VTNSGHRSDSLPEKVMKLLVRKWGKQIMVCGLLVAAGGFAPVLGCGDTNAGEDFAAQEKIAFISRADDAHSIAKTVVDEANYAANQAGGSVMIGTAAGGEAVPIISWPGKMDGYSFSGDGRFFSIVLERKTGTPCTLITTTDGSDAWYAPDGAAGFNFSPDSSQLVGITRAAGNIAGSTLSVIEFPSGVSRTVVEGQSLDNPVWVNDRTILYNEGSNHYLYSLDVVSGEKKLLSPPGSGYSLYPVNMSSATGKLAAISDGPRPQIWSLDLAANSFRQITNNDRSPVQSAYLPGSDSILFTESPGNYLSTTEICLINDDGSDFSMLTQDYDYDGNFQVSPSSGRITWQHLQQSDNVFRGESKPSIWVMNPDGSHKDLVASSSTGFLDKPAFAPVASWKKVNPLEAEMEGGSNSGEAMRIRVNNPTSAPVDAVLRAFPGTGLQLMPAPDQPPDVYAGENSSEKTGTGLAAARLEWKISLGAGESQVISMTPSARQQAGPARDGSLLVSVSVPDAQPLMFWQELG